MKRVGIGLGDCVGNKENSAGAVVHEECCVEGVWRHSAGVVFKEWSTLTVTVVVNRDHMELLPVGNTTLSRASTHPCATIQAPPPCNCPPSILVLELDNSYLDFLLLGYQCWLTDGKKKRHICCLRFAAMDPVLDFQHCQVNQSYYT